MSISRSAQRVQDAIKERGFAFEVLELPASTRTADDAARAVGCDKKQIVKSLIFRTENSREPILVLASGVNRVNEKLIAHHLGEGITKADAAFAREVTGFAIGGIPPVGHECAMTVFIDADLLDHDEVWAAAGTPNALFRLTGKISALVPDGRVVAVKET